jgi:hypothetical protein
MTDMPTSEPYHHSNLCHVSDLRMSSHINYLSIAILFEWMLQSLQYHWFGSFSKFLSDASMSVLIILRFASPINSPHRQLASRLSLTALLVCMPSHEVWVKEHTEDPELLAVV